MPSASKRALIRARISRATRHCSMGAVFNVTRMVISSAVTASTPQISGSSMITPSKSSSRHRSLATSLSTAPHPGDVLAVGERHVEHRARPVLALVADPEDLPVADVPDRAVDVPQPRHPQADRLHGAAGRTQVDHVADPELVLEDHEDPGQEVLDQVLRAEAERDTEDAGAGDDRADVVAQLREHHRDHDRHRRPR